MVPASGTDEYQYKPSPIANLLGFGLFPVKGFYRNPRNLKKRFFENARFSAIEVLSLWRL